jgi:hypothetical protein
LRACDLVDIVASGHLFPPLAELTGFQLAATHADDQLLCIYKTPATITGQAQGK